MPALTRLSSTNFQVLPLTPELSKDSLIGAEILFNDDCGSESDGSSVSGAARKVIRFEDLSESDISLLRQALFQHSVIVIRNQQGLDPNTLPALAAIWDDKVQRTHSGELAALTSQKNILSKNNAARIPRAKEVTILGQGSFDGYEGIPNLYLRHVVSSC